ncbi:MAG TPA: PVC-type heme-binding CxxCH protein [Planctomycetota bacterium]|nr:PVC-type heme-binding CxxCH protein [Planctomycetota bacterium]
MHWISFAKLSLILIACACIRAAEPNPPLQTPEDSLKKIHVRDGFDVELVAAEPLVKSPVAFDWDGQGRLWVVEMADYPMGMDGKGKRGGRVRILEDTHGDGHYDKSTLVADNLNFPNGILTWRDGALVTAAPDILFLRDIQADGKAREIKPILTGFQEGNQQLRVNGLRWGLDNWVYCASGGHHGNYGTKTKIVDSIHHAETTLGSRDFRFNPDTGALDPESGPAQFGRNCDDWGNWFGTQNSWPLWHYVLQDHYLRRNPYVVPPNPVIRLSAESNAKVYAATQPEKRYHTFEHADRFTSACSGMIERGTLFSDGRTRAFTCEPVHNLVQCNILEEDGVSFKMHRDVTEGLDFFASEDHWCRPVMVRSGPDGAFYVADMYRYMIEHPEWLPQNGRDELLPYYRAGEDCGRIYRIYPKGKKPAPIPKLDALGDADLVAKLGDACGWVRDQAQMMLIWRNAKDAAPALERMLQDERPLARLHAACTLDGLGALKPQHVVAVLGDKDARIRVQALRLAESQGSEEVIVAALKLVEDESPKVRLQLASSLGEWKDPRAGTALLRLLERDAENVYIRGAILSSVLPHLPTLAQKAATQTDWQHPPVAPLLQTALGAGDTEALRAFIKSIHASAATDPMSSVHRYAVWLEALVAFNARREKPAAHPLDTLVEEMRPLAELPSIALGLLDKDGLSGADKSALGTVVSLTLAKDAELPAAFSKWLEPKSAPDDQDLAVKLLARVKRTNTPELLLKDWNKRTPALRNLILDTLMSNAAWTRILLEHANSGAVPPSSFDIQRQARLRQHPSQQIKDLAAEVFANRVTAARAEVVEKYKPALKLQGDAANGKEVFGKICAACHRKDNVGKDIGPDLRSVAGHEPEKLLVSILDPSASIEPGYMAWNCKLRGGEHVYGIIATETASSLTFKLPDGTTRDVLRADIADLRSTQTSLMPDGLETMLTPQMVADVIRYLKTP